MWWRMEARAAWHDCSARRGLQLGIRAGGGERAGGRRTMSRQSAALTTTPGLPGAATGRASGFSLRQTRGLVLIPGRIMWQAGTPQRPRIITLTPAQVAWMAEGMTFPQTLGILPAKVMWHALGMEGLAAKARSAPPFLVVVRQVGDVWLVEVQ